MGWLVMAAAFITTFTACSSDDNNEAFGDSPVEPVRTVSVTVGAGITDDAVTRSGIIEGTNSDNKTTRTLKFTTGDKLFVRAMYGSADGLYYKHVLRGFLTMVGSPTNDDNDKSASFSGKLTQYDRGEGNSTDGYTYAAVGSITVSFTSDPIGEAEKAFATLVHKDAIKGTDYTDEGWNISYAQDKLTSDVNTLMTKYLTVTSSSEGTGYNSSAKSFTLNDPGNSPILNCTISGLTANTTYSVTYGDVDLSPTVTANASGVATFAFFGDESSSNHVLKFVSPSETKIATLGNKNLGVSSKIFNVSRTAN